MSDTAPAAGTRCAPWPKDALRVTFGVIWAVDATLKWLPGFKDRYMATIMGIAKGQPGWLRAWFDFWIRLQHPAATFFWALVAAAESLIALALILGVARKRRPRASAVRTPQGPPTSAPPSSTPSSSPACSPSATTPALARYSLDYYLERRISWWWRLAELRRPAPAPALALAPPSRPSLDHRST
ncbi:MAG: hypothetical protein ACYCYA_00415 [Actinomycetes bacterium]